MKNDGKDAEAAFLKHWEAAGHVQRLRDKRDLMGINGGARVADFAKPSDFIVSSPSQHLHYAEVKSTTSATSFAFGGIRPAQHAAAMLEAKKGAKKYAFYIFSYPLGEWFFMDCVQYAAAVDAGKRSIPFQELALWQK